VILAKLGDWSGLMGRRVAQARQILRHLLVGRIAFTPDADGTMTFVGHASIGPLLAGTALAGLRKAGVAPYLKALRSQALSWSTFPLALFLNTDP
jgi:hypothetical protein